MKFFMRVSIGFILRHIPDYVFSMDEFPDRLRLQKLVYLLQASGVYLGYNFSWYLRGPYCSILTANAFALDDIYGDMPDNVPLKFTKSEPQKRFKDFVKFVKGKDVDSLEIAASLHYLKKAHGDEYGDEKIKATVIEKQDRFERSTVDRIWEELKKWHLI